MNLVAHIASMFGVRRKPAPAATPDVPQPTPEPVAVKPVIPTPGKDERLEQLVQGEIAAAREAGDETAAAYLAHYLHATRPNATRENTGTPASSKPPRYVLRMRR